MDFAARQR